MEPLVSVNLTTYNRAHLLPRALISVLSQEYRNVEVNIVDDCSVDNTREVVMKYRDNDTRVRYFRHKKNQGNARARNTALAHANGKYVAFMDDDDEWIDPDKLRKQVELFESHRDGSLGIICSSVRLFSDEADYSDKIIPHPEDLKHRILRGNGLIYSPTVMTLKSIMEKVGGFDVNLPRGVDSEFYRSCVVKHGYNVHFMLDVTTAVHEYGDNRMSPSSGEESSRKVVKANIYLLKKYAFHYLFDPVALVARIRTVSVGVLRYKGILK